MNKQEKLKEKLKKDSSLIKNLTSGILSCLTFVFYFLAPFMLAIIVKTYLFNFVTVDGASMDKTLASGDLLMLSVYDKDYEYGDIVVFNPPTKDFDSLYIKRVIGKPGDKVEMKKDVLYINDKAYEELYVFRDFDTLKMRNLKNYTQDFNLAKYNDDNSLVVPEGQYFVMGDNRLGSLDSREFGFVPFENILGTVNNSIKPFKTLKE